MVKEEKTNQMQQVVAGGKEGPFRSAGLVPQLVRSSGKGRLRPEFVERAEIFSDRCVAVAERLEADGRSKRCVEQLIGSGTSVGANVAEADQAMSTADFRKCLAISLKELAETRFWLRLCVRRGWIDESQLGPLTDELGELRLVIGSILSKTRSTER